jgi:hypothetical protein
VVYLQDGKMLCGSRKGIGSGSQLITLMQPVNNGIIECTPEGKEIKQKAGKNYGKHL